MSEGIEGEEVDGGYFDTGQDKMLDAKKGGIARRRHAKMSDYGMFIARRRHAKMGLYGLFIAVARGEFETFENGVLGCDCLEDSIHVSDGELQKTDACRVLEYEGSDCGGGGDSVRQMHYRSLLRSFEGFSYEAGRSGRRDARPETCMTVNGFVPRTTNDANDGPRDFLVIVFGPSLCG